MFGLLTQYLARAVFPGIWFPGSHETCCCSSRILYCSGDYNLAGDPGLAGSNPRSHGRQTQEKQGSNDRRENQCNTSWRSPVRSPGGFAMNAKPFSFSMTTALVLNNRPDPRRPAGNRSRNNECQNNEDSSFINSSRTSSAPKY